MQGFSNILGLFKWFLGMHSKVDVFCNENPLWKFCEKDDRFTLGWFSGV